MQDILKAFALISGLSIFGTAGILAAQDPADVTLINPSVDHVLVSLPSARFTDLNEFLDTAFGEGWFLVPDRSKGFLRSRVGTTYVEIFDTGATGALGSPPGLGYQIAISSSDGEDGKRKAVVHFGYEGIQQRSYFTVGANYHAGHALGGTFFVSYVKRPTTTVHDTPVSALVTVVTTMPQFRMGEIETYRAFGFSSRPIPAGVEVHDTAGHTVCFLARPNDDLYALGHVALKFRLVEPVAERREAPIGDSGVMSVVFDGEHMWLLLRTDLFDPFSMDVAC